MTNERHEKALEAAEWFEHDGQGMPVTANTLVQVKFSDGSGADMEPMPAGVWNAGQSNWKHLRGIAPIVAYRLAPNHFTNGE